MKTTNEADIFWTMGSVLRKFEELESALHTELPSHQKRAVLDQIWFRRFVEGRATLAETIPEAKRYVGRLVRSAQPNEPWNTIDVLGDLARRESRALRTLVAKRIRSELPELAKVRRAIGFENLLPDTRESAQAVRDRLVELACSEAEASGVELTEAHFRLPLSQAISFGAFDVPVVSDTGILSALSATVKHLAVVADWPMLESAWFVFVDFKPDYCLARLGFKPSPAHAMLRLGLNDGDQPRMTRTCRLVLELDPTLGPEQVKALYSVARQRMTARHRQVEAKGVELARFAAEAGALDGSDDPDWADLLQRWNQAIASGTVDQTPGQDWSYGELWMFRRDCRDAAIRLLEPSLKSPAIWTMSSFTPARHLTDDSPPDD